MIYRITISIYGKDFDPDALLKELKGDFIVETKIRKGAKKEYIDGNFEFSYLDLFHSKIRSTNDYIGRHEESIVNLVIDNYPIFIKYGVNEIDLFYDIYYQGFQCNFEILDSVMIKKLSRLKKIKISFPISVYKVTKREMSSWSRDIEKEWGW